MKNKGVFISGDRRVNKMFKRVDTKVQKKIVRSSMRQVAKDVLLPTAKSLAPVDSGQLKKAMSVRAGKKPKRGEIKVDVQVGDKKFHNFYPKFVDAGTKERTTKSTGANRGKIDAQEFMHETKRREEKRAVNALDKEILKQIEKEANK
jgi:HK97 gp10 family phage protein